MFSDLQTIYHMCFCGVKLSRFTSFHIFHVFTFTVSEPQAGEIKPCVGFRRAELS